ncbi:MAG: hypothetical protein IKQ52_02400 [Bacteroidales bacterium]|jgi:hypothetical protein|nr:hypothetical protein [Bacteroidales bacterium]
MKSLKITKKEYQRVGYDAQDIEPVEYTEGYAEYDDNGHILREERYEPDGTLNTLTVNTYNENGELVQTEQYDQDDILLQKTVNKYDENQRLASQSNYYGDASEEYVTKYYYDAEGNVVKQEVYVDGNLDYVEKTATFVNGRPDTVTENDDYGNAMYVHHYQYDEKGQVTVYVRDEVQNKDRRTYEFTYNDNGDRVKDLIYDYDMKLIAKVNRTFDEQNRQTEVVEEDLDSYRRITMEYDEDRVVKNTMFDKNGEITGWAEYEYADDGRQSMAREFIHDEVEPQNFRMLRETFYERG